MPASKARKIEEELPKVEHFSVRLQWLRSSDEVRLDASYYNPRVAEALAILRRSGVELRRLEHVTERIFIPPRFKRIYVDEAHGVPFLQSGHIPHFMPADIKYLSSTAQKGLDRWIIRSGWVLVSCSGTIGRVTISPPSWDGWAASQHILRIVPHLDGACPAGYIYAFLNSELGQAQLTNRIYGAVVDEITEDHVKSILIPIPNSRKERDIVSAIEKAASQSVTAREIAVAMAKNAQSTIGRLIPELHRALTEDQIDVGIAKRRIQEMADDPEGILRGEELSDRLRKWLS